MDNIGNTVDRCAPTKENDEVDREGMTVDCDEVDRNKSTQEDDSCGIIFYIHPVPPDQSALLKGLQPVPQSGCYSVGQHIIFGRGTDVQVFLNDDRASRNHMELTAGVTSHGQLLFKIKNLSQKSLSLHINNEPLQPGGERFLTTRDIIKIGQLTFTVEINPNNVGMNMMYNLEFRMFTTMQYFNGRPPVGVPQAAGLSCNSQGFGVHQPGMPATHGLIAAPQAHMPATHGYMPAPQAHMPATHGFMPAPQVQMSINPSLVTAPPVQTANLMQPSAGFAIIPTNFSHPVSNQGQFPVNDAVAPMPINNFQFIQTAVAQVPAQERREMFQQSTGHIPLEHDDPPYGRPKSLSVEETQLPKLPNQTSIEETQPPKLENETSFEETQPPKLN